MNKISMFVIIVVITFILGCKEETILEPPYANTPVITSTTDAFSYYLAANSYSENSEYEVSFTSDSLAFSIVVYGYTSGTGSLTITDGRGSIVYYESLQSNKVHAFTQANKGIPVKINLAFNQFSGTFNLSLARATMP